MNFDREYKFFPYKFPKKHIIYQFIKLEKTVFSQFVSILHDYEFIKCISRYTSTITSTLPSIPMTNEIFDREKDKAFVLLTNNFEIDTTTIACIFLYLKQGGKIEFFFRWIIQHLKSKSLHCTFKSISLYHNIVSKTALFFN